MCQRKCIPMLNGLSDLVTEYPLKERKTFVNFNMKEKLEAIELLNDLIVKQRKLLNMSIR